MPRPRPDLLGRRELKAMDIVRNVPTLDPSGTAETIRGSMASSVGLSRCSDPSPVMDIAPDSNASAPHRARLFAYGSRVRDNAFCAQLDKPSLRTQVIKLLKNQGWEIRVLQYPNYFLTHIPLVEGVIASHNCSLVVRRKRLIKCCLDFL